MWMSADLMPASGPSDVPVVECWTALAADRNWPASSNAPAANVPTNGPSAPNDPSVSIAAAISRTPLPPSSVSSPSTPISAMPGQNPSGKALSEAYSGPSLECSQKPAIDVSVQPARRRTTASAPSATHPFRHTSQFQYTK